MSEAEDLLLDRSPRLFEHETAFGARVAVGEDGAALRLRGLTRLRARS